MFKTYYIQPAYYSAHLPLWLNEKWFYIHVERIQTATVCKLTCDVYNEVEGITVYSPMSSASIKAGISWCYIFNPQVFPSNQCSIVGHQMDRIFSPTNLDGIFQLAVQLQKISRKYILYIKLRDLIFGWWLCKSDRQADTGEERDKKTGEKTYKCQWRIFCWRKFYKKKIVSTNYYFHTIGGGGRKEKVMNYILSTSLSKMWLKKNIKVDKTGRWINEQYRIRVTNWRKELD